MNKENVMSVSGSFCSLMKENGFLSVPAQPEEFVAYFKETGMGQTGVVLAIDFHRGFYLTKELYQQAVFGLEHFFLNRKGTERSLECEECSVKILTFIIAEDVAAAKQLFEGVSDCWIFDAKMRRLMIYENQPEDFMGIRKVAERLEDDDIYERMEGVPQHVLSWKNGALRKIPVMTVLFMFVNILEFFLTELFGDTQNAEYMLHCGAMYAPYIKNGAAEYYRFLQSMFLHFGFLHLVNNMLVLYFFGDMVEKLVGKVRFLVIYLLSGILGNVVSVLWAQDEAIVSAGASGAIYGLIGALTVLVIYIKFGTKTFFGWDEKQTGEEYSGTVRQMGFLRLAAMLVVALYFGSFEEGIDTAAHLGGFFSGMVLVFLTVCLPWIVKSRKEKRTYRQE